MNIIAENLAKIKTEIGKTELIAVSKKQPIERLHQALEAGHRVFGENRVQEAQSKFPELQEKYNDLELHLIGPLQTNKAKDALALFDVIQTVDREKLARKLADEIKKHVIPAQAGILASKIPDSASLLEDDKTIKTKEFMVQVNIGEEEQKAGIPPQEAEEFTKFCVNDLGLNVTGLMCIPPADEPAGMYFALLRNISLKLARTTPSNAKASPLRAQSRAVLELMKISMGMSGDYLEAIEMGATHIRVGSAIFGQRAN